MRFCPIFSPRIVLALIGSILGAPVLAQPQTDFYITSRACLAAGLLSPTECRDAFANAEAEFEDSVPVFDDQSACERHFSRCTISFATPSDPTALRFGPAMKGIQVIVTSKDRTVVPVLGGSHPAIQFSARTVLERRDIRSSTRYQEAQARWAAAQRPQEQPTSDPSTWALRGRVDIGRDDAPAQPSLPPLATKLLEWCRQFCEAVTMRADRSHESSPAHPGLFAPHLDAVAQFGEPLATRHFRPLAGARRLVPPRFVHASEG